MCVSAVGAETQFFNFSPPSPHVCTSMKTSPILSRMCSNTRWKIHVNKKEPVLSWPLRQTPWWHKNTYLYWTCTIVKPLQLSAPMSESFITSLHRFYGYNFHFMNRLLLVPLPNAPNSAHSCFQTENRTPEENKAVVLVVMQVYKLTHASLLSGEV